MVKVPVGEGEAQTLGWELVDLGNDPERCRALEQGARNLVDGECHWSQTAKLYEEYWQGFPVHRPARKGLFARHAPDSSVRERIRARLP